MMMLGSFIKRIDLFGTESCIVSVVGAAAQTWEHEPRSQLSIYNAARLVADKYLGV